MRKKIIKLTENELKDVIKGAVDKILLHNISETISYDNPLSLYLSGKCILDEGLIMTHRPEVVKKHFCSYLGVPESWFHIIKNNDVPFIVIDIPDCEENQAIVDKALDFYGYFRSAQTYLQWKEGWIRLQYEPKNQEKTLKMMYALYHLTPRKNLAKILQQGLCPKHKNKNFDFPERIYLFSEDAPMKYIENMKTMFSNASGEDDYTLLTIDRRKIPNNVELHNDPNCEYGYWTTNNIPPSAITEYSI